MLLNGLLICENNDDDDELFPVAPSRKSANAPFMLVELVLDEVPAGTPNASVPESIDDVEEPPPPPP
jgi:hypothetical protein